MTPVELVSAAPQGPDPAAGAGTAPPSSVRDVMATGAALTSEQAARDDRKRRRAEREAKKRAAAEKRRATREAKKAAAPAATAEEADDEQGDVSGDLERDAGAFLSVVYRVVGLVVGLFGADWTPVPKAEAMKDGEALAPLLRKFPGFARFVGFIAAPFVVVERIASSIRRRKEPPAS